MLELVLLRKWESVCPMNFIICLRKKDLYITHCKVQEDGGVRRKVVTFTDKLVVLPSHNRVKVMFECPNHSGSISSILSMISDYGVNLTEIHSRPFWKDNSWNYKFFVEMNANAVASPPAGI